MCACVHVACVLGGRGERGGGGKEENVETSSICHCTASSACAQLCVHVCVCACLRVCDTQSHDSNNHMTKQGLERIHHTTACVCAQSSIRLLMRSRARACACACVLLTCVCVCVCVCAHMAHLVG